MKMKRSSKKDSSCFSINSISLVFLLLFCLVVMFFMLYQYVWRSPPTFTTSTSTSTPTPTPEPTTPFSEILDNFAQTISRKDLQQNSELFHSGGTINFFRLMSWLTPSGFLTVPQWINQTDVMQAEFITNHMTLTNQYNITSDSTDVIGFYTYTLDTIGNTTNLPTVICSFMARFTFLSNLILTTEVLENATCTFLWYSSAGVDGTPVIPMAKRAIPDVERWNILLGQIDSLLLVNQRNVALSICITTQFLTLKVIFDPFGIDPANQCNSQSLNTELTIPLTCSGYGAISATCLPDSYDYLQVTTLNVTNITCPVLNPLPQSANTVYAGPISGSPFEPTFRALIDDDINNVSSSKIIGILQVEQGGTGSNVTLTGGKVMVSSFENTIIEGPDIINVNNTGLVRAGDGITITLVNGSFVISADPRITSISLTVPADIFMVTSGTITNGPAVLSFDIMQQFQNTFWAGPTNTTMGYPSFREIVAGDLPNNIPISKLTGILPIEQGGTNSGSPLINNTIMVSYNGQIVEASIINGTGITTTVNNGIIMITNDGLLEMSLSVPSDILAVSGSPTSGNTGSFVITKQLQIEKTFFAGPIVGTPEEPVFRTIHETDLPTLLDGQLYIGSNGIPTPAYLQAGTNVNITFAPGTIIISAGSGLNFTGGTGTVTSVGLSLPTSIFDLTNSLVTNAGVLTAILLHQDRNLVWAGPTSGIADLPTFRSLVEADLPILGLGQIFLGTGTSTQAKNVTGGTGIVISLDGNGNLVITATTLGTVTSVGLTVPTSILSVTPSSITSTGTFSITLISQPQNTIFASPDGSSGIPTFRSSVVGDLPQILNGQLYIGSTGSSVVASTLTAGPGVNITNAAGSITISTSALVSSVGLSLPVSVFSVTVDTVTSSGVLTAIFQTQTTKTFFSGPISGAAATPTFRVIATTDLPALGNGEMYIGNLGIPTVGTIAAGNGITVTPGPGTLTISTTALVSSVGLSLPVSVFSVTVSPITTSGTLTAVFQTQSANTIFAGPTSGGVATPTFRTQVTADLPQITNGQLYIGSTGSSVVASTLTAGNGISITNAAGSITINSTTTGTVTSVGLSLPVSIFSVSGTPVTTTGTLTGTLATQTANKVFAGPTSGGAATPAFRALVAADIPAVTTLTYTEVSSSTTISAFSTASFTVATTMTTTPAAGTYQVTFSASAQPSTSAGVYEYAIFNGVTQLTHSTRSSTGSSGILTFYTQGVVVADGSGAVTLQWRKTSGSGTADMFQRSMFLLRIS